MEAIREFANMLEAAEFWYKTPQEKNILLMQKSGEERHKVFNQKAAMAIFPRSFSPR